MNKNNGAEYVLPTVRRFFLFFASSAFIITCCMTLFLTVLSKSLGIEFTDENISLAAKLTFINVTLLSLIITVFDTLRRKITVKKPVKSILDAADKVVKGDFSVRIEPIHSPFMDETFNEIIERFNKMANELSGIETLRTDFIANVSHEMKTPLAAMQNYASLLMSEKLSEDKRIEYAKALLNVSRRLSDMVTNILKLTRLENQNIYPTCHRYDLGEQLCECLLGFENVWESKGIEIETDIPEDIAVNADSELLSLVWNNLFSNALKFTERDGKVTLSLKADESFATVTVADTGIGMTPQIGEHIFEKFYQGDTSHATKGNGLGLALVKRVVDILGAEIGVESALGAGTTFTVKIRRNLNGNI